MDKFYALLDKAVPFMAVAGSLLVTLSIGPVLFGYKPFFGDWSSIGGAILAYPVVKLLLNENGSILFSSMVILLSLAMMAYILISLAT